VEASASVYCFGSTKRLSRIFTTAAQALRSEDKALLERCLAVGAPDVIANTVARLQPPDAAALLRAGVGRLQSRPRRARQLAAWLQALVLAHTAYLIAAPGPACSRFTGFRG